jgi:glucose-1-phosphatase
VKSGRPTLRVVTTGDVDVVLFDLGGVLVDFGGVERMRVLADIDSDDALWERWLSCRWVREFERGRCSPEVFAAGVVEDWQLALEPSAFLAEFRGWPVGPFPGASDLVDGTSAVVEVGCLSNTNVEQWERHAARWPLVDRFTHRFLSFEMGMVKPDVELFDHVASVLGTSPARILFLDDNPANVDAALQTGFRAVRVRGVVESRHALAEVGIVAP